MDSYLAKCESVLAAQRGLVTRDQLEHSGVDEGALRRLVDRKVLRRDRARVYALVGATESWERGLQAVVLSVPDSVASHSAAARLWDFDPRPAARYEITVDRKCFVDRPGVTLHRSKFMDEHDITNREGIDSTSFERTLSDCTTLLSQSQLGRALDNGLRRGVASLTRLKDCLEQTESGPGRHMATIRSLLAERGIGFDPGGSRSELQVLDLFRKAGLSIPVQQHQVRVGGRKYRPDFAWPDLMVFAEYYGAPFHTGASAVAADSQRLTALASAGWLPLVFTWESSDREIVERTTIALEQRRDGREFAS